MAYTRSTTGKVSRSYQRDYYVSVSNPQSNSQTITSADITIGSSITGVKVDDWRGKIRRHEHASSALSAWKKSYNGGMGYMLAEWTDLRYSSALQKNIPVRQFESWSGRIANVTNTAVLPSFDSATDDEARAKMIKQATEAMRAFSGSTEALELRETLRMLRNPAKGLRRAIRDHMKRTAKSARRIKNRKARRSFIRDSYLEGVFGWTPAIGAVRDAGSALNRRLERYQGSFTRVSGQATKTEHTFEMHQPSAGSAFVKVKYGQNVTKTFSSRYYGMVRSVAKDPIQADMRLFGFTWGDAVLAGWEIVPWSFLVDYFTNIGDVLDSWTLHNSDWVWNTNTRRYFTRCVSTQPVIIPSSITGLTGYEPSYGWTGSVSCSPCRFKSSSIVRSTPLGPPSIGFDWELPGRGQKWLNMAALARTHRRAVRSVSY